MSRYRDFKLDCKIYVGDLGHGAAKHELEDAFGKYGRLRNVWVARNPPGFAFVEFEDPRDADDAVRAMDGARLNGRRVRVEMSTGKPRRGRRPPPPARGSGYGGGGGGGARSRRRSRSYSPHRRSRSYSRSRSRSGSRDRRRSASSDRRRSRSRNRGSRLKRRRNSSGDRSYGRSDSNGRSPVQNKRRKKSFKSEKSSSKSWSQSKSPSRSRSGSAQSNSRSRSRSQSVSITDKKKLSSDSCKGSHKTSYPRDAHTSDENKSNKDENRIDNGHKSRSSSEGSGEKSLEEHNESWKTNENLDFSLLSGSHDEQMVNGDDDDLKNTSSKEH